MIGKLTPQQLNDNVLTFISHKHNEVKLNSSLGQDCSVLKTDKYIYLTTDPITSSGCNCGSLAINICCNDLAASGANALAVLLTILAPKESSLSDINELMNDASNVANELNVEIIGGHTEFTDAVNRMIVSCTAIGVSANFKQNEPRVGDSIILTKSLGLEGSAILSVDNSAQLNLSSQQFKQANDMFSMISVVREGLLCSELTSSMHDITEGGILGAISEMELGCNIRCEIDKSLLPFENVTEEICKQLNVDKYTMLSSGCMLMTTDKKQQVLSVLSDNGIKATVIGTVKAR